MLTAILQKDELELNCQTTIINRSATAVIPLSLRKVYWHLFPPLADVASRASSSMPGVCRRCNTT